MARWAFSAALTDGTPQHALDARSRQLSFPLDGPSEASFSLNGRDVDATHINELTRDLVVHCTGTKLFRGRIGQT